ncbi:hypothetical protein KR054_010111 [Drosophila jambulina]|nr:hypothetical protein KR054_010111 [Drosophila jambulina]
MSVTISEFYRTSLIFWSNLIAILLKFIKPSCRKHKSQNNYKPKTKEMDNRQYYNMVSTTMVAFVEMEQKRVQRAAQEHAKVDLLHRLLVQQQLQDLQRRRLMRLAAARRRLMYSN